MALTAAQRRKLPSSAFVYPSKRKYPVPTKSQARKAGISEKQRLNLHRNALSRASQKGTSGSYRTIAKKARARSGGKVATVSRSTGVLHRAGTRKRGRKR